jgi:hypothetical protein
MCEVPTKPHRGQVIDLLQALKASLEKRGVITPALPEDVEKPTANVSKPRVARPTAPRRTGTKK